MKQRVAVSKKPVKKKLVKKAPKAKTTRPRKPDLTDTLLAYMTNYSLAGYGPDLSELAVREYKFHQTRKWRADLAFIQHKLLVECEGGTHSRGRHSRPVGYANDCRKYNAANLLGYRLLRYTSDMIKKDPFGVINEIRQALGQ